MDCSYGFRPGQIGPPGTGRRFAATCQRAIGKCTTPTCKGYFDTIPHDKLLRPASDAGRGPHGPAPDPLWLEVPIVETDDAGPHQVHRSQQGTPQGGVISPLLANVYLHWFESCFTAGRSGHVGQGPKLVRYADDFVILARYQSRSHAMGGEDAGRTLSVDHQPREDPRGKLAETGASLNFLGFTFRYDRDLHGRDRRYLNVFPSKKSVARLREKLRVLLAARTP